MASCLKAFGEVGRTAFTISVGTFWQKALSFGNFKTFCRYHTMSGLCLAFYLQIFGVVMTTAFFVSTRMCLGKLSVFERVIKFSRSSRTLSETFSTFYRKSIGEIVKSAIYVTLVTFWWKMLFSKISISAWNIFRHWMNIFLAFCRKIFNGLVTSAFFASIRNFIRKKKLLLKKKNFLYQFQRPWAK